MPGRKLAAMPRPAVLLAPLALGLLCIAACSSDQLARPAPWADGGLSVTLLRNVPTTSLDVSAVLQNRTGGRIQFGPPGCGDIETFANGAWRAVTRGVLCSEVIYSLDNAREYPFVFSVPATAGRYRLVIDAVNANDQRLTVRTEAVTVP